MIVSKHVEKFFHFVLFVGFPLHRVQRYSRTFIEVLYFELLHQVTHLPRHVYLLQMHVHHYHLRLLPLLWYSNMLLLSQKFWLRPKQQLRLRSLIVQRGLVFVADRFENLRLIKLVSFVLLALFQTAMCSWNQHLFFQQLVYHSQRICSSQLLNSFLTEI